MSRGPYTCCLCGSEEFGYGHNPAPLAGDQNRACDSCNATKVIPARLAMMFPSDREFASEDSHELATAAIVGGIFTVSMGALLEHLGTALNKKDAAAATFFKDCIDYMGMSMVSSYEENTKDFPKEVKYAIDMTLGMTAKQLGEWEKDPEFEELTNLGSSEDPDVDTMSEVVLDDAQEFEDDFGVMYSAEARQSDGVKRVCHRNLTMHCNKYSLGWVVCPACNQPYTDEDVVTDDEETDYDKMAESYADFFTQMEELLESTTIAGGWTLDATTDQEDPDAVTMVVKFKPSDPSTFFDIIE